jgi:hypothetical protein
MVRGRKDERNISKSKEKIIRRKRWWEEGKMKEILGKVRLKIEIEGRDGERKEKLKKYWENSR